MTPERIAALEAAAAENDEMAGEVLQSMLVPSALPADAGPVTTARAEPATVLDEAVSPVAGRRFSRN
jgi:hypothetical protein